MTYEIRLGFKPMEMPEWWDADGKILMMGGQIILTHRNHRPRIWDQYKEEWEPINIKERIPKTVPVVELFGGTGWLLNLG